MTETLKAYDAVLTLVLDRVKGRLGQSLTSVVLFGSRVKGGYKSSSDLDFLVVYRKSPEDQNGVNDAMVDVIAEILFDTRHRASIIALSERQIREEVKAGSPFLGSVMTGYRILYDKEGFMARALENLKGKLHLVYKERGKTWDLNRTV